MKAAQISQYGDPSVIKINDIPLPVPGPGQVLVKVYASSLNPADSGMRNGAMKDVLPMHFPSTLGGDFAGVVTGVGEGVTNVAPGDKVFGQAYAILGGSGALAEYTVTDADRVAIMPKKVDFTTAAAFVLVGASAVQALQQHMQLQAGQKIVIHGGAGGIGQLAIQLAKSLGAYVATTVAGKDVAFVSSLGADEIFDYQTEDFSRSLSGYDGVVDLAGGAGDGVVERSLKILKPGATIVSLVAYKGSAALQQAQSQGFTVYSQQTKVTTDILNMLRDLIEKGVLTLKIAEAYPLEAIQEAFQVLETRRPGKIVIEIVKA
jgi:alcohol dehydrogenase